MHNAPNDKCPIGAMPNTTYKKSDKDVPIVTELATPATSHGNIYIIFEPAREGYVPPTPEVCDTDGEIWPLEVVDDVKSQCFSNTHGHQ